MKYSPSIHNVHIFTHRNVDDDLLAGLGGEPPQTGGLGLRRGRRDVPGRAPLRAPARRAAVALLDLDDVLRTQLRVADLRTIFKASETILLLYVSIATVLGTSLGGLRRHRGLHIHNVAARTGD